MALVVALGASEVVVAALAGVSLPQVAVLAVAAFVFVLAYLVTPSPGKPQYDARVLRPVGAMAVATLVALAATGGLLSPLLPLGAAPVAAAWALYRPRRVEVALAGVPLAALLVLLPATFRPGASLGSAGFAALAGWSLFLSSWLVGRRVAQLFATIRSSSTCLARIREGVLEDAASRRRALESMATKLAHELKNPLAAMKTILRVELEQNQDPRSSRRLDVVLGETERIGNILREYLELARPTGEVHVSRFQLEELMTDVSTLLAGRAEAAAVELSVQGTHGALEADQRLLKEAVMNLVSNAIEATPRGGSVSVTYEVRRDGARIVIRDTGTGMSQDVSARVGTPFFTTREGGTGLGVVIARTAILQHGGTLEYKSAPGAGTTAIIALPLAAPRTGVFA